ncbi:non-structural maintenance of chromosomes element 4 homolog A [Pteronotus mesoamericanus]|uniref:non-structural maintenance of chromosomes element 4 homolog A n=1 Tax=Pteronotus mesoamericanus TaxID=1884717 RepID=UPI0023EBE1F5|nr:non-structural maintenance of chromosomes element 4 homolog A [Pteronotus parnellii mesoamericanus]XP_054437605.1 non-structural maintenance of chromosomes element 4 homolog A [Pteronotus parnellii mesoamericanus]
MSGDSSGRRPEGRGRGRDPHRDRPRSRSRSRSPLSSRRGVAPERREAPERPSLEEGEPSDSGDEMVDPATLEAETDHGLCRQIRHQYRALINSVQQNREDILNASDKLTEVLEEANTLFNGVSRAREAVLDAHFLVLASDLGKEKAKQLRSDLNSFDMLRYVETLLTHMGVNPLEAEDLIRDEDSSDFEFIVYDSWKISGKTAENTFNKTHTFHFLLGSIQGECPVPKPRTERPRRVCTAEKEKKMPEQLKRMEESHQEATEKEVERILGLLQTYFREDPDTPMSFFDFVIDPHSFPRTVENIFHVSFIVRDGFARIKLDQDRLPIIEPVNINEESEGIDQNTQIRNQGIIALSYRDWEEIVKTFEISEPVIVPSQSQQSLST